MAFQKSTQTASEIYGCFINVCESSRYDGHAWANYGMNSYSRLSLISQLAVARSPRRSSKRQRKLKVDLEKIMPPK
jgi:hypothetical protein